MLFRYPHTRANLDPSFEVEDNFSLFVKYSNGAFATMDGSYCTPSSGRVDDLILNIVGSKGSIRLLIQKKAILLNMGEDPAMSRELIETTLGGRYEGIPAWNMIDDLINSILFDREPLTCGEDARRVNALVEAGYQSLASRMPVKISQ